MLNIDQILLIKISIRKNLILMNIIGAIQIKNYKDRRLLLQKVDSTMLIKKRKITLFKKSKI